MIYIFKYVYVPTPVPRVPYTRYTTNIGRWSVRMYITRRTIKSSQTVALTLFYGNRDTILNNTLLLNSVNAGQY